MSVKPKVKAMPHLCMPGETITGAIKKYNQHDVTADELKELLVQFKEVNTPGNPKPGVRVMIPVLERHHAAVFKSKVSPKTP